MLVYSIPYRIYLHRLSLKFIQDLLQRVKELYLGSLIDLSNRENASTIDVQILTMSYLISNKTSQLSQNIDFKFAL